MGTKPSLPLIHRLGAPTSGGPPHPTLLLMHGRGASEDDPIPLGSRLDPRLLVLCPRAPITLGPGSFEWYDLEASLTCGPARQDIDVSLELVRRFIEEAGEIYPIDGSRLYVAGFSQGGAMSACLCLLFPSLLAGCLIFSGYLPMQMDLPFQPAAVAGLPVFQAHGTYDQVLPVELGRLARDYLCQCSADLTYREYPMGHEIAAEELAEAASWMGSRLSGPMSPDPTGGVGGES